VGLLVIDHLQATARSRRRNAIGLDQLVGRPVARRDRAGGERAQGLASAAQAQRRIAAAEDQLLVWAKNSISRMPRGRAHVVTEHTAPTCRWGRRRDRHRLALDRVDVMDGGEVEVAAPDIRCEVGEERGADGRLPATGCALIMAARSQFWPTLS